jgi:hypothetical protein
VKYNVIDTDSSMLYDPGQEIIGSVDAASPDEAITLVMKAIGVDVLRAYGPEEYAATILKHVEAVPALEPTGCTCYVAELDAETQFGLRWGAHALECPRYRRSLDPVDDANDQDYRATHS